MDKVVVKRGKIFQAGEYKDKNFAITPKELETLAISFKPVNLDLNHKTTLRRLDSKIGKLEKVAVDERGQLFGEVHIPEWFNEVIGKDDDGNDVPIPVSCTFHPETKQLLRLALTDTPRVTDAAIFAAFSAAHPEENVPVELSEPEDNSLLVGEGQVLTDGIFPQEKEKPVVWSGITADAVAVGIISAQEIHERAARSGAVCGSNFSGKVSEIQKLHDLALEDGAACLIEVRESGGETATDTQENKMSKGLKDKAIDALNRVFSEEKPVGGGEAKETEVVAKEEVLVENSNEPEVLTKEEPTEFSEPVEDEEVTKLKEALARVEAANRELVDAAIKTKAKNFAMDIIRAGVAVPASKPALEAMFAQAIRDDESNAVVVTFGEGETQANGSRVDVLKAAFSALPTHNLTEEVLNPEKTSVLLSNEQPQSGLVTDVQKVRQRAIELADRINSGAKKIG